MPTCAISGKEVQEGDNFFGLPAFPCGPQDPLANYCEACVLRDEFEKWELREVLVQKVKEFWGQWLSTSEFSSSIFHDDIYLIVKNRADNSVRIHFIQHLFLIHVQRKDWKEFYGQMMGPVNEISIGHYTIYTIRKKEEKVEISETYKYGQDRIEVTLEEWEHLQDALRIANKSLLDW